MRSANPSASPYDLHQNYRYPAYGLPAPSRPLPPDSKLYVFKRLSLYEQRSEIAEWSESLCVAPRLIEPLQGQGHW